MSDIKTSIGIITIILTLIGYFPYIRDIFLKKTKPHVFSWFIWGVTSIIIYALQVSAGAGSGSWVTFTVAVIMFFIFFLSLKGGEKYIKPIDVVFLILALTAIPLWLIIDQPLLSMILLTAIDCLGFAPTIRKSWNNPYTETLSTYVINAFRHGFSIFALVSYNAITVLFPIAWVAINICFILILVIRRRN